MNVSAAQLAGNFALSHQSYPENCLNYFRRFRPFLKVQYICFLFAIVCCVACTPTTTGVDITAYNHMKRIPIHFFTVDGALGPNVSAEGGGKQSCCVAIPKVWRSGSKIKIAWVYDSYLDDPNPPLPSQVVEMELPRYSRPGTLQVHFYAGHRVKLVVSSCRPGHAFYPMSAAELLPWTPRQSKEEADAAAMREGRLNDC
jgi:hypothetical protein